MRDAKSNFNSVNQSVFESLVIPKVERFPQISFYYLADVIVSLTSDSPLFSHYQGAISRKFSTVTTRRKLREDDLFTTSALLNDISKLVTIYYSALALSFSTDYQLVERYKSYGYFNSLKSMSDMLRILPFPNTYHTLIRELIGITNLNETPIYVGFLSSYTFTDFKKIYERVLRQNDALLILRQMYSELEVQHDISGGDSDLIVEAFMNVHSHLNTTWNGDTIYRFTTGKMSSLYSKQILGSVSSGTHYTSNTIWGCPKVTGELSTERVTPTSIGVLCLYHNCESIVTFDNHTIEDSSTNNGYFPSSPSEWLDVLSNEVNVLQVPIAINSATGDIQAVLVDRVLPQFNRGKVQIGSVPVALSHEYMNFMLALLD